MVTKCRFVAVNEKVLNTNIKEYKSLNRILTIGGLCGLVLGIVMINMPIPSESLLQMAITLGLLVFGLGTALGLWTGTYVLLRTHRKIKKSLMDKCEVMDYE